MAAFNKDKLRADGLFPQCRECRVAYSRQYRNKNKDEIERKAKIAHEKRKNNAEAYKKYLEKCSLYSLKRRYGITSRDAVTIGDHQGGVCGICKSPPIRGKFGGFCIDHDHKSNKVRGLLCNQCNSGLGMFKDNPEFLAHAIKYLANPPAAVLLESAGPTL